MSLLPILMYTVVFNLTSYNFMSSYDFIVSSSLTRFLGTPFFHSMVARSLSSSSDISVLIDPDTILLADFVSTLKYVHKLDDDWMLVASSRKVSGFPFSFDSDGKSWVGDDGKRVGMQKVC